MWKKYSIKSARLKQPPMADTTTDAEEKRMEKRDAREQMQDAKVPCLQARMERGGDVVHH